MDLASVRGAGIPPRTRAACLASRYQTSQHSHYTQGQSHAGGFWPGKNFGPASENYTWRTGNHPWLFSAEQYGVATTDARSDVYALGATLYRLAANRDPLESVLRVSGEDIMPVRESNPQVPVALAQAIETRHGHGPGQRFQNATELHRALKSSLVAPIAPPPVRDYRTRDVEMPAAAEARRTPVPRLLLHPPAVLILARSSLPNRSRQAVLSWKRAGRPAVRASCSSALALAC